MLRAETFSPSRRSMRVHQMSARTKAQMPMKTSMNILVVVAVISIQPSL